jgi:cobalamin biosynthesis protein CobW
LEHFFDRPWQATEQRQTRLVLIGRALERVQIEEVLCSV